jgi:hypothetical protein
MKLSDVALTMAARLRNIYRNLPETESPKDKCTRIAQTEGNGLTADRVRFMISFGQTWCICSECWKEFTRDRTAGFKRPQKCEECYHQYVLNAARECRKRGWVPKTKRTPTQRKFMRPDELRRFALRELAMTEREFGEALADVRVRPTFPHKSPYSNPTNANRYL